MLNTHVLGVKGEIEAKEYLLKKHYKILETNYENSIGEIDIIAKDNDTIVFIEVKKRFSLKYGYPREAVTFNKQKKIKLVAQCYLKQKRLTNKKLRFDVIEILDNQITHLENAF